ALNTNLFAQWILTNAGRRSYLLGTTAGRRHFRDAGLWPVTEPPVFSQHGGTVPPGYALTMASTVAATGQTATIYFTLDGTDPRLPGGALGPGALIYGAPVVISNVVVVKARARNDTTAEWSPLTEALFAPSAVSASASNLVIAEIMYHPPDATTNEVAAGFRDADEFEFLRLMNIGAVPLDLAGVRFSSGVTFDFNNGAVRYVNPGASVLVVKRHAAFRARYGSEVDALVAGEYTGNLSNGGERLALVRGASTLRDFSYGDGGAWPESPDGDGPSLLLRDPFSNPAHGLATNWMASAMPGGMPAGTPPSLTFARWQALFWDEAVTNAAVSGPEVDADLDGLVNFAEYALGLHPRRDQPGRRPQAGLIEIDGRSYLTLRFTTAAGAMEAEVALQWSSNVIDWNDAPPGVELLETTSGADGTTQWLYRTTAPLELTPAGFLRLQVRRRQGGD
ncbi:MAG TPA: lamin tail domain-containing protein, partial [Methylomirabilota bacterium]|nr:lamin tail domain-containing protein [Methylomirabilota bacterium]